ncbi:hypothetical protein ACIGQC_29735 [Streptomyces albidoflavus]
MQKSATRPAGTSIPAPARPRRLMLVYKKGPAFSSPCPDCNGFDAVVTRGGQTTTIRCACQLAVTR